MGVKLLPKSQIAELKAKERSVEIQEGAKLATRVDGLRELQAKTEQEFEAYRTATLDAIHKEIIALTEEKENVGGELRRIKEEYDLLLPEIPLKRAELAQFEKKLFSWEKRLQKKEEKAGLLEIDVAEASNHAKDLCIRAEDNERITRNLLMQANKQRDEASSILMNAKNIEIRALKDKKETEDALFLRDMAIRTKETYLAAFETSLTKDRTNLNKEKIKVEDIKATLERSIKRIREGRLA